MFANLRIALEALGGAWHQIVRVKTYLVDGRSGRPTARCTRASSRRCIRWLRRSGPGDFRRQILLETELVACLDATERRMTGMHAPSLPPQAGASAQTVFTTVRPRRSTIVGRSGPFDASAQAERMLLNLARRLDKASFGSRSPRRPCPAAICARCRRSTRPSATTSGRLIRRGACRRSALSVRAELVEPGIDRGKRRWRVHCALRPTPCRGTWPRRGCCGTAVRERPSEW